MAQYASLDEAFGGKWGTSKNKSPVPREQDVHSSQKTYNSPTRRTEAAITQHADLIKNTMKSLPFGDNDNNYAPARVGSGNQSKNQIEPFYVPPSEVTDYKSPPIPGTGDWSYASTPPAFNQSLHFEAKLDRMMRMMEGGGGDTPSTHDLLLYVFTGVFALFLLDSFVTLGKHSRR